MKNRVIFGVLFLIFLIEFVVLILFTIPKDEALQDTVAVNEVVKTVRNDWNFLDKHSSQTSLEYVVIDLDGAVLYRTRSGLSESMNAAISHKDTILDIEAGGEVVGKLLLYNNNAQDVQAQRRAAISVILAAMLLQCCICIGYFFYLRRVILRPFDKMKDFARRVAGGNLDIPLEMDKKNLFGAFTESFDLMRSELKKARIAEARANEEKKELVAKLSHDIKTPVASIKAAAEVGAALSADERNTENYEQIIGKADQINTLVTNLFSAALEELQELSVTPAEFQSAELKAMLEAADYLHRAKIPPVPACMLSADRLRLQQVFDNIFANSYKYADTEIQVDISAEECCLVILVEDYGGGVDEAELLFLKEKFRRGSNTKNIEGAGLGLYIADYCMRKMKGRIDVVNGLAGLRVIVRIAYSSSI